MGGIPLAEMADRSFVYHHRYDTVTVRVFRMENLAELHIDEIEIGCMGT